MLTFRAPLGGPLVDVWRGPGVNHRHVPFFRSCAPFFVIKCLVPKMAAKRPETNNVDRELSLQISRRSHVTHFEHQIVKKTY